MFGTTNSRSRLCKSQSRLFFEAVLRGSRKRSERQRRALERRHAVAEFLEDRALLSSISGTKFEDANANGIYDPSETPLAGVTIYLDLNDNGELDAGGEPTAVTDVDGNYTFTNVIDGEYVVREVVPDGYEQTYPLATGARLFAIDPNVTNPTRIVEVDPADGTTINSFNAPGSVSGSTAGLAYDGETIFFVDSTDDTLYEIDPDTGSTLDSLALDSAPRWDGVAVLDGLVYVSDPFSDTFVVVDPTTNSVTGIVDIPPSNFEPFGGLGELPDESGGQLVGPVGSSGIVALLDPTTGALNSSFLHATVNGGTNFGVTSIDGQIYLGFNDSLGTVLVYEPDGTFVRSIQTGFDMSGLGAADTVDGAHRVTLASGQDLVGLDFGNILQAGSISGTKFEDFNGNGERDSGEGPLSGVTIYIDANDNGVLDVGETSTQTLADGTYELTNVPVGQHVIREVVPAGFVQTAPVANDAFFYAVAGAANELITIDAATGLVDHIGLFGTDMNGLVHTRSGELFGLMGTGTDGFYSINTTTGAATLIGTTGQVVFGLAYDDATDTIYTIRGLGATRNLAAIDRTTGATTIIGAGSGAVANVSGLAFDAENNQVIAFDNQDDEFWGFDVTTGNVTLLSDTSNFSGFGFTPVNDGFVMSTTAGNLVQIDPFTAVSTPFLTMSETLGIDALDYVPPSVGEHRVTVLPNTVRDQVDFGNKRNALTVSISDAAIAENGGVTTATVTRNTDTANALVVSLLSDDTTEATVVGTVTIAAGETTSPVFNINAVNDEIVDGTQTVTITASAADHADGAAALDVEDDDTPALTVSIDLSSISENGGTATGTVTRNTATAGDLVVALSSDDTSEATVPPTVTIPDGQSSATFTITGVDEDVVDGTQAVNISATTAGAITSTYSDDFAGAGIGSFWSPFTDIPGSSVTQTDGVLRVESPVAPGGFLDTGVRSSVPIEDSNFVATVDFRIPQGSAMSWLSARAFPSGSNPTVYGLYHYPPENSYRLWIDASVTGGGSSAFGRAEFGDESTHWHELEIRYDAATTTADSFVDGTLVNTTVIDLNNAQIALMMKDSSSLGSGPTVVEFDNFSLTTGTAFADGVATINVTDDDTLALRLSINPVSISENGGTATGTVTRNDEDLSSELVVSLSSGDITEATVPATVTIPVGQSSADFIVTAVDDSVVDGTQVFSISASATGYIGFGSGLNVRDDDTLRLTLSIDPISISENGGTAAATVTRNAVDLSSELVVNLLSSDTTEASVPATVTIPAGQSSADFIVTAIDDEVVDGTQVLSISASAVGYIGFGAGLNVTDDDTPALTLSINPISISENGGTATGTVVRNDGDLSSELVVALSSNDTTEVVVPATVTIPAGQTTTTFTVAAVDDAVVDGTQTPSISASASGYIGYAAGMNITDDDVLALTLSVPVGNISENGGAVLASVSRNDGDLSSELIVTLSSDDVTEATVPASVTIPAGESNGTFTITAVDDAVVDGLQTIDISASAAGYVGDNASVNVADDDVAGFTVSGGTVVVDESGTTGMFSVVLTAGPLTDVVFTVIGDDTSEAVVAPVLLTFTAANWNVPQEITVTGVDDLVDDGSRNSTITVAIDGASSDDAFDALAEQTVTVQTTDDDVAGFVTSPNTGLVVTEGGDTDSVSFVLTSQPTADVTFDIVNGSAAHVTFSATTLTFTPADWIVAQNIIITAIDDDIDENSFGIGVIPQPAVSLDPNYDGRTPQGVNGSVIDNDTRGVTVSNISGNTTEAGGTATFSVVLTSEPTANVEIPLSSDDASEGTPSSAILSFSPTNWDVPQIVTVQGVDDALSDGDVGYAIVTGAIGGSSDYAGIDPGDVAVVNEDEDPLALTVTISPVAVSEAAGASAAMGTVSRNAEDLSEPLIVTLTSSDTTEATTAATVTIPASESSATFAVDAIDDAIVDGAQSVDIAVSAVDYIGDTETIAVTDDDTLALTLALSPISISESGDNSTGTITRNNGDLSLNLIVAISSSDTSEATVPATVTIPSGQPSATFVITAVDDAIVDGTQVLSISVSASGYIGYSSGLNVTDNDSLALTLSLDSASISEGGGAATGTVSRNDGDLSSALVVNLSSSDTSEASVPGTVTIPAGQSSANFTVSAADDAIVDGTQVLSISASALGYTGYSAGLNVTDDDTLALTLSIAPISISENGGTATGTISRNDGDLSSDLVVVLNSSDTSEATVPLTATIPAGQSSAEFSITAVDDAVVDGTQVLSISASAAGYIGYSTGVNVTDDDTLALLLSVAPISISESGGTATGTVTRNDGDLSSDLIVTLQSDDTTEATVPGTVTISAGQASADFTVTAVDDNVFDGTQAVAISATASSYIGYLTGVNVIDNDTLGLSLSLPATSISEAGGNTNAVVTLESALESDLEVSLASSDVTAATVPTTITIPAGQTSGVFLISGVDDNIVDGTQSTTITANAPGVGSDSAALDVTDNDVSSLSIFSDVTSISENGGSAVGTAQVTTPLSTDLVVSLASSDTTEAVVPESVTIPAGTTTATFAVVGVDDLIDDDSKTVTISATSSLNDDSFNIIVADDDVAQFAFSIAEATINENGGVATGTVSLTHALETDFLVDIAVNISGFIDFPAQVTIPAGSLSSDFSITGIDDDVDRNDFPLTITATSDRGNRTAQITVIDDDTAVPSLSVDATEISENGGTATATLTLSTPYFNSFFLTLSSSDTTEATVPANVFVASGSTTATFTVTAVDDALLDGMQTVTITGSSILGDVSAVIDVTSDDVNQPPTGAPVIIGSAVQGEVLTAGTSGIVDPDGVGAFSYQWLRDGVEIPGETAVSYSLGSDDVGSQISVSVSFVDGNGSAEGPLTSDPTATVTSTGSWFDLAFEDFEDGLGMYTDGGRDARLYTGGTHSHQGRNSANLQDNSGRHSSIILTDGLELDTPDYTGLRVEFWFKTVSFEFGEDFFLEYSDGSGWQTIGVWTRGPDFRNNRFNFASVEVTEDDVTFTDNARIRLRADASGNRDDVYIDEIRIQAFGVPPANDPPVAQDDAASVLNNASVVVNVLENDSDPNDDALAVTGFTQASNGSVTDNGDGTLTYTPAPGFVGTDSFMYTISDGRGGTATGTVTVDVTAPPTWTDLAFEDFENGFGSYTDGGRDARLYTGGAHAHQGDNAVNLQDNSGTASSATLTNSLDLSSPGYTQLRIEFWFKAVSFESGEDFFVQYYDGSSWQTVSVFTRGVEFKNNQFNFASIEISSDDYTFSSNARIRLMDDASSNGDDVYIDEILISAR